MMVRERRNDARGHSRHAPEPVEVATSSPFSISCRSLDQTRRREVFSVPQNLPIVITQSDFVLLHRLAGHPHLTAELKKAVLVDSRRVPANVVTMGSRVRFEDEITGECRDVTIVFPQQANPSLGLISVLTTVGTALLGLAVGQSIVWPFPDGTQHCLRVLRIIYQPEADNASG
jgi:regulator of nucleoside diphosphate kinase